MFNLKTLYLINIMMGIYIITNPTGKVYIGQSANIENRIQRYHAKTCKDQPLLYNSIIKYGWDQHQWDILEVCQLEKLNDRERYYIAKFQSNKRPTGLNLTSGGQDYFFHSAEVRLKMSAAQKGNKKTLGRIASIREIQKRVAKLKGKKRTAEQRARMSKARKGIKLSAQHIENMKKGMLLHKSNMKKVIDTTTGQIFPNCKEAANYAGVKKTTLIAKLNGQNPNNTTLKYLENVI